MEHFFSPNSGEDQTKGLHQKWNQARSQKFAMEGLIFGSGGGASSRQKPMGAGGVDPIAGGDWGSGGGAPSARNFCIFLQK